MVGRKFIKEQRAREIYAEKVNVLLKVDEGLNTIKLQQH